MIVCLKYEMILRLKAEGGKLVNLLIVLAEASNSTGLTIFLTPTGQSETATLISMINNLPQNSFFFLKKKKW